MPTTITAERPDTPDAIALIEELESVLAPLYPAESRHGFSVEKLIRQGVAFFVTRVDNVPVGCGGILLVGQEYGELKRMYVRPSARGKGYAKLMVTHLEEYARKHGVPCLRLETGILQRDAISLYERMGFERIGPFGEYRDDPLSRFYEKKINH
ncbi:MAG: GNAT family N-acetyltransferase [Gemmataceae bacterium]